MDGSIPAGTGGAVIRFREDSMNTTAGAISVDPEITALVSRARAAQAVFETFSQEQVDGIVRDMGKYV